METVINISGIFWFNNFNRSKTIFISLKLGMKKKRELKKRIEFLE
jgi:hypothetical protein